ncbi:MULTISPECIES: hypothetical protein [Extibacter]|uniref:hypothetical protein n=1 Tax=Extibacter TaxID=1918452 RepID=UPI001AA1BEF1|nr:MULTISPECIES: hypothetical protein [Extibacter]BDF35195.1 hypothetical protein CE91St61_32700 [Lachnospiraceae bacterium]MBO1721519.1 hypothetical protein [Extibacter sp. GGCC_0201]MCB6202613.1 hypothetical protein [Extibacter muris]MCQ4663850.1 hypothetical protein [Extibacter muris]MCQ4693416.1 hypothetical protein [Extibacter muris]
MKDLSDLKLDLLPEALRNAAGRESHSRQENTSDITIPFPEELQQKEDTDNNK